MATVTVSTKFYTPTGTPLVAPTVAPTYTVVRTDTDAVVQSGNMVESTAQPGFYFVDVTTTDGLEYLVEFDGDPTAAGQTDAGPARYAAGHISGTVEERFRVDVPAILADTSAMDARLPAAPADETTQLAAHAQTQADIAALNNLSVADVQAALTAQGYTVARAVNLDFLDVSVDSRESGVDAAAREAAIIAAIAALNDLSVADVQAALNAQGYTVARAVNLDFLDVSVDSRESAADAAGREANVLAALAALNDLSIGDVQTALSNQGYTVFRANLLDFLDATISSRQAETDALARHNADLAEHAATQALIGAGGGGLTIADVQTALTLQGYTTTRAPFLDFLDATISSRESDADAATRALADLAEHANTQAAIGALNDIGQADVQAALDAQGYTTVRAVLLDNLTLLDVAVSTREAESAAATRQAANLAEHAQTQADIAALPGLDVATVQAGLTAQGYTVARAPNLDNLDALVSSREAETDAASRASADLAEHAATQAAIGALNDITIADVQTALTLQGYTALRATFLDASIASRESESDASSRASADLAAHNTSQGLILALNDLSQADVQAALDAQGYTSARAGFLDASIASRESEAAAAGRQTALLAEHAQTQADIGALENLSVADVQAALTAQGYTSVRAALLDFLDVAVSTRESEADAATRQSDVLAAIAGLPSAGDTAGAVWDENLLSHIVAGTTGAALRQVLDLNEADETLTSTTAEKRRRGTPDVILSKNVSGVSLPDPIVLEE